jgi:Icc-related predicted phosphoesterase
MGLFGRRKGEGAGRRRALRAYYASDIHGSEVLWRKFLNAAGAYRAQVLIMGGDVTGKGVVPRVERDGGYDVELFGQHEHVTGEDEVVELEHRIRANGMYPHRMTAVEVERVADLAVEEREEWFGDVMRRTFDGWLALADERLGPDVRCFVMPGNDDPPGVDAAIEEAARVEACDDRIVEFEGHTMISLGWANRTPFDSPRELDEDELYRRVAALADQVPDHSRSIFNLHVPPYDSQLDTAAELDAELNVVMSGSEPKLIPVGSTAVRELIERYQPMLALHGHVHESPGAVRIGRTLCINPGSDYHTGRISGCLLTIDGETTTHQFVTG